MDPLRAVLDANVVASGLMRPQGPPGAILKAIVKGDVVAVWSPPILDEIRRTIGYSKVRKRVRMTNRELELLLVAMELLGDTVEITQRMAFASCTDPDDWKYLETALEGKADFLVSGDSDLLSLGTIEGTQIMTPRTFLGILSESSG